MPGNGSGNYRQARKRNHLADDANDSFNLGSNENSLALKSGGFSI